MTTNGKTQLPTPLPDIDPALTEHLDELLTMANEIGAAGAFILRGAQAAALAFSFTNPDETEQNLVLEPPHETIVLLRFPASDGQEAGIESR